jgi:hypothetical protein
MYAVKNILFILMIAAPILLAIRLAFLFFKGTVNPDEKNLVNKIRILFLLWVFCSLFQRFLQWFLL